MDRTTASSDQRNLISEAKNRLHLTILQSQIDLHLPKDSPLLQRASRAVNLLTPAETYWLYKKDWNPEEKTFVLYHVDRERSKKKPEHMPLGKVAVLTCLASTALAAQYKDHHTIAGMLALVATTTACSVAIDYAKNRIVDNIFTQRELNTLAQENDHVKTGMRCLSRRIARA